LPHTDDVIGVTSKEGRSISRPGNGNASRVFGLWLEVWVVFAEFSNEALGFEIPDFDCGLGGST